MTETNQVLLRLLDEIDSICSEHGLSYFLSGRAAWSAYNHGEFISPIPIAEVLMPFNDILEFSKYIDRTKRDLESVFSNMKFRSYNFNYVDSGTLYYDIYKQENEECPGIHVRIRAIKQDNGGRAGKSASRMKRFWKRYNDVEDPEEMVTGHRFRTRFKQTIVKNWISTHYLRYYRKMLDNIVASQKDFDINSETYINRVKYDKGYKNRTVLPEGFFSGYSILTLEGHKYRGTKEPEKLLELFYGKKWKEKTFPYKPVKRTVISSTTIPYADFIKSANESGMSFDKVQDLLKVEKEAKAEYLSYEKPIRKIWQQTQRNILVNKMSLQYLPAKRKILKAYKEGRWDDLSGVLTEIDEYARQFAKFRILVNFDKDIMEVYHAWLLHIGDEKFENKLRKLEAKEAAKEEGEHNTK